MRSRALPERAVAAPDALQVLETLDERVGDAATPEEWSNAVPSGSLTEEQELLLLRRSLASEAGYDNLAAYVDASAENADFLTRLLNDLPALRYCVTGGDPNVRNGRASADQHVAALDILRRLRASHPEDLAGAEADVHLRTMVSAALAQSGRSRLWSGDPGFVSDPLVRYETIKTFRDDVRARPRRRLCGVVRPVYGARHAALVHLYDRRACKASFVERLVPGAPVRVIRPVGRHQGLIVAKGDPRGLRSWEDIVREDVRLVNRERGCGSCVLLDEKMFELGLDARATVGYDREVSSALTATSLVARGAADVCIGSERVFHQVEGVDFLPCKTNGSTSHFSRTSAPHPSWTPRSAWSVRAHSKKRLRASRDTRRSTWGKRFINDNLHDGDYIVQTHGYASAKIWVWHKPDKESCVNHGEQ